MAFSAETPFDFILMDVQMPQMTGVEATHIIRGAEEEGEHIPIAAVTANAMCGDREVCIREGMDDYISKPVSMASLRELIQRLMGDKQPHSSQPDTPSPEAVCNQPIPFEELPVFDLDTLRSQMDGDMELIRKLVTNYAGQIEEQYDVLVEALGKADQKESAKLAHKLKGSAGNFAAKRLHSVAQEVEQHCKNDQLQEAQAKLPQLNTELQSLAQVLSTEETFGKAA